MSLKSKVFAAATTLTLVGGVATAGAMTEGTASAATPSCGPACLNLFVQTFSTHRNPNFVLDSFKQRQSVGNPVILFRGSNSDPAEDFTVSEQGTVNDFFQAGLVSSALALHFGCVTGVNSAHCTPPTEVNDQAYEIEYSPYGAESGLCVGVGSTAANYTTVSLQPCGVSSKTVWVVDSSESIRGNYVPLINGSDTNFSTPYVLTYPQDKYPTDSPRPQLITLAIQGYSTGTVFDRQMWSADFGPLK